MVDTPFIRFQSRIDSSIERCLAKVLDDSVFLKYADIVRDRVGVLSGVDTRAKLIKHMTTHKMLYYTPDNTLSRGFVDTWCDMSVEDVVVGIVDRIDYEVGKQLLEISQPIDSNLNYNTVFYKNTYAENLSTERKVLVSRNIWRRVTDGTKKPEPMLPCDVLAFREPISLKVYHTPCEETKARNLCYSEPISDRFLHVYLELSTNPVKFYLSGVSKFKVVIENPEVVYASK